MWKPWSSGGAEHSCLSFRYVFKQLNQEIHNSFSFPQGWDLSLYVDSATCDKAIGLGVLCAISAFWIQPSLGLGRTVETLQLFQHLTEGVEACENIPLLFLFFNFWVWLSLWVSVCTPSMFPSVFHSHKPLSIYSFSVLCKLLATGGLSIIRLSSLFLTMECPALSGFTYQCCCWVQLATAKSSVSGSLTSSRTLPVQKTAAKSCSHPFLLPLMPTPSCSCSYKSSFFPFFPSHFLFHNPFTFPRNNPSCTSLSVSVGMGW